MRIHVVGHPQTDTTSEFDACGFTNKTIKFCWMLKHLGHTVYLYGGKASTALCDEFIPIVSAYEQKWVCGGNHYTSPVWSPKHPVWVLFNQRTAREIKRRGQAGDPVCTLGGNVYRPLAEQLDGYKMVEYGIGYFGYAMPYKVWESAAWKALMFQSSRDVKPKASDPVIQGFFDEDDFPLGQNSGYLLYVGRLIEAKGVKEACEAAKRSGRELLLVGPGDPNIITYGRYLGCVSVKKRNELMAGADALLCPTQKYEAFGNIVPEAGMCGTRVLSGPLGGFQETVLDGVTGWRCAGVKGLLDGISMLGMLEGREAIRKSCVERFSVRNICKRYDDYFKRLSMGEFC